RYRSHSSRTSVSPGLSRPGSSSPRPSRLTSLSSRNGLNRASTSCSQANSRSAAVASNRSSSTRRDTGSPMTCSTRRMSGALRVEGGLERLPVAVTGDGGAGHGVDVGALLLKRLFDEGRHGGRGLRVVRLLEHPHGGDAVAVEGDLDPHRSLLGL